MTRILAIALGMLLVSGCATLRAPLSQEPVDQDHRYRTLGARVDDQAIEHKVAVNVARAFAGRPEVRVVAVAWNGQLLLAGQVPTPEVRQQVEQIARDTRRVVHLHNELVVGPRAGAAARLADTWLTLRVKSRLLLGSDTPGLRVKVLTENGAVYLMGLVTEAEGGRVVEAARSSWGAQKIVKIFEYIPPTRAGTTPAG